MAGQLKRGQNLAFYMNRKTLGVYPVAHLRHSRADLDAGRRRQARHHLGVSVLPLTSSTSTMSSLERAPSRWCAPISTAGMRSTTCSGMSVVRDDLTRKKEAVTEWTFRRYLNWQGHPSRGHLSDEPKGLRRARWTTIRYSDTTSRARHRRRHRPWTGRHLLTPGHRHCGLRLEVAHVPREHLRRRAVRRRELAA